MTTKRARLSELMIPEFPYEEEVLKYLLAQPDVVSALESARGGDLARCRSVLMHALSQEVSARVEMVQRERIRSEAAIAASRQHETVSSRVAVEMETISSLRQAYMVDCAKEGVEGGSKSATRNVSAARKFLEGLIKAQILQPELIIKQLMNDALACEEYVQPCVELISYIVCSGGASPRIVQQLIPEFVDRIGDFVALNPKAPDFFILLLADIANNASVDRVSSEQIAWLVRALGVGNIQALVQFAKHTSGRGRNWALQEIARFRGEDPEKLIIQNN